MLTIMIANSVFAMRGSRYTQDKAMEEGLFRVPGMKTTIDAYHDAYVVELDPPQCPLC